MVQNMELTQQGEALVSVIVPIYNAEKHIRKCVDSLVNQTYQNTEIILVDDGSPDTSGKICDEYAGKYDRVKVIHKSNGGVSAARNTGMSAASGQYIHFCDADDWIEPETYSDIVPKLVEEDADVALFGWYVDTENKGVISSVSRTDHALDGVGDQYDIFHGMLIICGTAGGLKGYGNFIWNKIYKKESLIDENGNLILFDETIKVAEDGIWLMYAGQNWNKGVFARKAYYHYYTNNESVMNTAGNFSSTRLASQQAHMRMLDILKDFNRDYYEIHRQACITYFWIVAKSNPAGKTPEFVAQVISNIIAINDGVCPEALAADVLNALKTAARYRWLNNRLPVKMAMKVMTMFDKVKKRIS